MSFAEAEVDSVVAAIVEDTPQTTDHATSQPVEATRPAQPLLRVGLISVQVSDSLLLTIYMQVCLSSRNVRCIMQDLQSFSQLNACQGIQAIMPLSACMPCQPSCAVHQLLEHAAWRCSRP